jgi:hypothetical protein
MMEKLSLIVAAVAAIAVLVLFIVRQSKAKGRWGIGRLRTSCPRCGTALPVIRKPASEEEMLWGGWTCPNCGCKVDKYGKERTP